jgi:hypothetical protein
MKLSMIDHLAGLKDMMIYGYGVFEWQIPQINVPENWKNKAHQLAKSYNYSVELSKESQVFWVFTKMA